MTADKKGDNLYDPGVIAFFSKTVQEHDLVRGVIFYL